MTDGEPALTLRVYRARSGSRSAEYVSERVIPYGACYPLASDRWPMCECPWCRNGKREESRHRKERTR